MPEKQPLPKFSAGETVGNTNHAIGCKPIKTPFFR